VGIVSGALYFGAARTWALPCDLVRSPPEFSLPVTQSADSDEVARAFRDDVARCSDMMSPGVGCLAGG
jgi:hypothetical protein